MPTVFYLFFFLPFLPSLYDYVSFISNSRETTSCLNRKEAGTNI